MKMFEEFSKDFLPYKHIFSAEGAKATSWKSAPLESNGDLRVTFETPNGNTLTADFVDAGNKWEKDGDLRSVIFDMVQGSSSDGQLYSAEVIYEQGENSFTWQIKAVHIR